MTKRTLSILALVILAAAGCDQDRTGALSANGTTGASASAGTPHPVPATPAQPLPGWQIHINSYAKFAVWHPPGWAVSEHRGQDRSLELRLIPPGGQGGVLIRRRFAIPPVQTDLPNTRCSQIRISQLPALRCMDTISGSTVAALTGTGQGDFTFQASRRAPGFGDYDNIVASFQLLRGA